VLSCKIFVFTVYGMFIVDKLTILKVTVTICMRTGDDHNRNQEPLHFQDEHLYIVPMTSSTSRDQKLSNWEQIKCCEYIKIDVNTQKTL